MNVEVEKSYGLLRFINKPRSRTVRFLYAILGWCALMVLGSPMAVAADSFRLAREPNGVKIVLRRIIWFVHTGWLPISIRSDFFFDISEKMSPGACKVLIDWIGKNRRIDEFERLIWQADLHGGIIERHCDQVGELWLKPGDPLYEEDIRFCKCLDAALARLGSLIEKPLPESKPSRKFTKSDDSFDKADAYATIADLRSLMSQLEWPWYVVSGTLLGAVREQEFLGHDYDIDVGVDYDDFDLYRLQELVDKSEGTWFIKASSYCVFREPSSEGSIHYHRMEKPILVKLVHRTGLVADLFVHVEEEGVVWHGSAIHRWDNSPFELADYQLGRERVKGAADADRYLTENYGDWRTPVLNFDCSVDPPNIRYSKTARAVTYLSKVVYRFLLDQDIERAKRYLDSMTSSGVIIHEGSGWRYNGSQESD